MWSDVHGMVIYSLTRNTEAIPPVLAQKSMNEGYYVDGIGTSWKFMREAALDYGVMLRNLICWENRKWPTDLKMEI